MASDAINFHTDRTAYARLKRARARRDWNHMNHNADAKAELVATIIAKAKGSSGDG